MWCRPSTTTTTTFTNQQDFATNELLFSATSFLFIAPVSWKLLWEQNIWAWVCEMISAQLLAAHLSQIYRICYETVTKDSLQCEYIGTFFLLQTVIITKAITISDFSTGDASTPLFRPEFLTSWEHLAPCNNVRMLCYCTKMMVCWRGENWPSFLSRAAKNFSCSVKNYDLLIAAAATKVASTIPNSSGVIFLDMLFLLSYFWWGLSTKINK